MFFYSKFDCSQLFLNGRNVLSLSTNIYEYNLCWFANLFSNVLILLAFSKKVLSKTGRVSYAKTSGQNNFTVTNQVGNNCLTYIESVNGLTTCCTVYNKMMQMLENKDVGQSWNDWVCQKDTRLAKSRDLCKDHGLTHVEVSLSFEEYVPTDGVIEALSNA